MNLRQLIKENKKIQELHNNWSLENDSILEKNKDAWNLGIMIRNHTRDFIDNILKIIK